MYCSTALNNLRPPKHSYLNFTGSQKGGKTCAIELSVLKCSSRQPEDGKSGSVAKIEFITNFRGATI